MLTKVSKKRTDGLDVYHTSFFFPPQNVTFFWNGKGKDYLFMCGVDCKLKRKHCYLPIKFVWEHLQIKYDSYLVSSPW